MKTILVTGGAGFVGSHLCERLIADGHKVVCLDNLITGSKGNIAHLMDNPCFEFVEKNICDTDIIQYDGFDEIYNLACPASPIHYQNSPVETTMTCTQGVYNILTLATKCGAKILQASTSEVYGNPEVHPQKENYFGNVNPCGIRSCYDEGKRCAESLCFDFHRLYGTQIRVIRIFNTYGERMAVNDGRVVSNFIIQALKGEDMTIYGDGEQTRSFQYVSDLVEGMLKMMDNDFIGPLNIGNPSEYTINQIAEIIRDMANSKSEIVHFTALKDDPVLRRPDISKAKSVLDWKPTVSLVEGLNKTINYFKYITNQ